MTTTAKPFSNLCKHCVQRLSACLECHHPSKFSTLATKQRLTTSQDRPSLLKLKHPSFTAKAQHKCYNFLGFRNQMSLSRAVSDAEKVVGYPTSFLSLRCLLSDEMSNIALHMRKLVGTKHPLLKTARGMVFDGNHNLEMRGLFVMLISKAAGPNPHGQFADEEMVSGVYPSQRSLAEIMEVIHTASLIHKGIVNIESLQPELGPTADMEFGNKMAVLCGDYLLASACTGLAKLGNPKVVEEVASSIGDLMTAEFTGYTNADGKSQIPESNSSFSGWLNQTYLSFGSLLAKSCQAAMRLAGHSDTFKMMAFKFGENASYVQELAKDIKSFTSYDEQTGLQLTSAPILLYKEKVSAGEFAQLQQLWDGGPANYEKIVSLVMASGVVGQCKELLSQYKDRAIASLTCYPESEAKEALINMVTAVSNVR